MSKHERMKTFMRNQNHKSWHAHTHKRADTMLWQDMKSNGEWPDFCVCAQTYVFTDGEDSALRKRIGEFHTRARRSHQEIRHLLTLRFHGEQQTGSERHMGVCGCVACDTERPVITLTAAFSKRIQCEGSAVNYGSADVTSSKINK